MGRKGLVLPMCHNPDPHPRNIELLEHVYDPNQEHTGRKYFAFRELHGRLWSRTWVSYPSLIPTSARHPFLVFYHSVFVRSLVIEKMIPYKSTPLAMVAESQLFDLWSMLSLRHHHMEDQYLRSKGPINLEMYVWVDGRFPVWPLSCKTELQ